MSPAFPPRHSPEAAPEREARAAGLGESFNQQGLLQGLGLLVINQNNLTRFSNTECSSEAEKYMLIIL